MSLQKPRWQVQVVRAPNLPVGVAFSWLDKSHRHQEEMVPGCLPECIKNWVTPEKYAEQHSCEPASGSVFISNKVNGSVRKVAASVMQKRTVYLQRKCCDRSQFLRLFLLLTFAHGTGTDSNHTPAPGSVASTCRTLLPGEPSSP